MSRGSPVFWPPTPPAEHAVTPAVDLMRSYDISATRTTGLKHVWIISGPAGCGKTSLARHLHNTFAWPYLEGDEVSTNIATKVGLFEGLI